jgi:hypothetical protein
MRMRKINCRYIICTYVIVYALFSNLLLYYKNHFYKNTASGSINTDGDSYGLILVNKTNSKLNFNYLWKLHIYILELKKCRIKLFFKDHF